MFAGKWPNFVPLHMITTETDTNIPWYRSWFDSPYYHQLYFNRNSLEASAFVERMIAYLNPAAGSRMLDAGCGMGRHARILADHEFDVTGIDLSLNAIRQAKVFETERLHFFQHDLRLPFWINYFHYAFNMFTSFGYFKTERENMNVIRTIASSLQQHGTVVIDYLNVHYAEDHQVHKEEKTIDGTVFYLTRWFDENHFYKRIVIEDDSMEEPIEFVEKVAKYTLGDFNDMFAYHKLQLQEVFGDYHFSPYHIRRSPRLLMVAKKAR